jgi:prepilin-type N-terminal cleavage/methylation domain-containing protein
MTLRLPEPDLTERLMGTDQTRDARGRRQAKNHDHATTYLEKEATMTSALRKRLHDVTDEGFTLIELLIVVVILGILAGIVVFAVGGITDRGKSSACSTEKKTIQTAEEANFAQTGSYSTTALLVPKFLADAPTSYEVTTASATAYTITPVAGNTNGCT